MANELAFADVLQQMRSAYSWLPEPLYTVGGAASHGLIYVLTRALIEHQFQRVLELGVGETTKVLSAYSRERQARILSLEDNEAWASELRERCGSALHRIEHAPLTPAPGGASWYDPRVWEAKVPTGGFDLILVDGPIGTQQLSRVGIVDFFSTIAAPEWLVIWDDLDRLPDLQSFVAFTNKLRAAKVNFRLAFCSGTKVVGLACTPRFASVEHYF